MCYSVQAIDHAKKCAADPLKTSSKGAIQKKRKQLVISLVIKLLIELRKFKKIHNKIIQRIIKKYLKKNMYLQKKDKKLLMN